MYNFCHLIQQSLDNLNYFFLKKFRYDSEYSGKSDTPYAYFNM